ncbi:hypothetical protein ACOSQ2_028080 [Xanthoceras sorbifolium]
MNSLVVLVIVFVIVHLTEAQVGVDEIEKVVPIDKLQPAGRTEYRVIEFEDIHNHNNTNRRMLVPYQMCLLCKCCTTTTTTTTCLTMPCCFGIDCNLPNKPFGVCAFVPKTCNCTSCT